jgi:hypothetical protein
VLLRIFLSIGNIVFSLILGAVLLVFVALNSPETASASLKWAHSVKEIITGTPLAPRYNFWIEFLLDDRQLVFMGFVVLARILLGLVALPIVLIRDRLRSHG